MADRFEEHRSEWDRRLRAYANDEGTEAERAALEAFLRRSPEDQARLRELRREIEQRRAEQRGARRDPEAMRTARAVAERSGRRPPTDDQRYEAGGGRDASRGRRRVDPWDETPPSRRAENRRAEPAHEAPQRDPLQEALDNARRGSDPRSAEPRGRRGAPSEPQPTRVSTRASTRGAEASRDRDPVFAERAGSTGGYDQGYGGDAGGERGRGRGRSRGADASWDADYDDDARVEARVGYVDDAADARTAPSGRRSRARGRSELATTTSDLHALDEANGALALRDPMEGLDPGPAQQAPAEEAGKRKKRRPERRDRPRGGAQLGFATALMAAGALAFGYYLGNGPLGRGDAGPLDWRAAVAASVSLQSADTYALTPAPESAARDAVASVGDRLGLDLSVAAAPPLGLSLKEARILSFGGRDVARIDYLDAGGAVISLAVVARSEPPALGERLSFETEALMGQGRVGWMSDLHEFLLVGGASSDALLTHAHVLAKDLN